MPKIPVLAPPYKNVDEVAVLQGGTELIDGYFDETGALNRRWGLWSWWSAGGLPGVDGLFWWKDKQVLVVVAAGRIYAFTSETAAPTEVSTEAVRLNVNRKVHFAATDSMLFMSNGNLIVQWNGTGSAAFVADGSAPTACSGLVIFAQRLVAVQDGTQRIHLTEAINEGDTSVTWKPTWFTPNSNSDFVTQLAAGWNELTIFGPYSTEIWYYTGVEETPTDVPFARLEGAAIERGILSPDSLIFAFNAYWWLDQERRIVRLEGRQPKIVSLPIDRHLRALTDAKDVRGFQLDRWVVWAFPKDDVTWVYDTVSESWMKWAKWNPETALYERYLGQDCAYIPEWGKHFLAGRKDGRVLIAHPNLVTDIFEPIRTLYRSAHFDHGTMARKVSHRLMLRLKRGA